MRFVREENGVNRYVHSSFWCKLLRGGATCHRGSSLPLFFLSTPPLPFSFLFFRHIGAIYGLVQEGGEIEERGEEGGGSDKSLVVKRGDHGGREGRERRGGGCSILCPTRVPSLESYSIFPWWGQFGRYGWNSRQPR